MLTWTQASSRRVMVWETAREARARVIDSQGCTRWHATVLCLYSCDRTQASAQRGQRQPCMPYITNTWNGGKLFNMQKTAIHFPVILRISVKKE